MWSEQETPCQEEPLTSKIKALQNTTTGKTVLHVK